MAAIHSCKTAAASTGFGLESIGQGCSLNINKIKGLCTVVLPKISLRRLRGHPLILFSGYEARNMTITGGGHILILRNLHS
jgi:hypothetical protein